MTPELVRAWLGRIECVDLLPPQHANYFRKNSASDGQMRQRFQRPPKNVARTMHFLSAVGVRMSVRPVNHQL